MEKKDVIETLDWLRAEVEDNWDLSDPEIKRESEECSEALTYAIELLETSKVVGSLEISGKRYLISK